jgi:hypothetical protein
MLGTSYPLFTVLAIKVSELKGITDFKENFFVKTIKMIKKYNQMYL